MRWSEVNSMHDYAEELRDLAIINNTDRGCGYTDLSNTQSGATRLLNSGSDLLNNYIDDIRKAAYDDGYIDGANVFDIKSAVVGGVIAGSIISITGLILHIRKCLKNKDQNTDNNNP